MHGTDASNRDGVLSSGFRVCCVQSMSLQPGHLMAVLLFHSCAKKAFLLTLLKGWALMLQYYWSSTSRMNIMRYVSYAS